MTDTPAPSLPRPPEPPPPFRFPLLATLAPVVVSVALWLVTGSVFALMFAALGPVTAVASFVDSRLGSRRLTRREQKRFADEIDAARATIRARLALELTELDERTPDAAAIVQRRGSDHGRWANGTPVVTLGRGRVGSVTPTEHRVRPTRVDAAAERELDDLASYAGAIELAPIVADATLGIGVFGPDLFARAIARGYAVQVARSLAPSGFWCAASAEGDPEGGWLAALPHGRRSGIPLSQGFEFGPVGSAQPCVVIAVGSSPHALPGVCAVVVGVGVDGTVTVVQHPERSARQSVIAAPVSREEATEWACDAAADAHRHGVSEPNAALPASVRLAPMLGPQDAAASTLAARVALTGAGTLELDLVEHGPHAVVGGTTGSGKSELLIAWVIAMAAAHPPERVTFLLVDFKGGAAFSQLRDLPHTVGTITDLDASAAARALASLRAELTHRERTLATAGVRDIDEFTRGTDAGELPRLVIVVDEFAAMLSEHPDLHALFADLASRGRSLGVHLVLCTQRPAGVVRDGVLANADLRISLRVNNPGDSVAVVGTDAAAFIPAENRGRAVVVIASGPPRLAQFALADPADARSIMSLWPHSVPPRRPWLEPLPNLVSRVDPDGDGVAFGLLDLPHEQRRAAAMWREEDGHILVLGAPGSGKSSALRSLVGQRALYVPAAIDAAWDVVAGLHARLDAPASPLLVAIDDLDALLARFAPDHRAVVVERLARVLREGGARGIRVAVAAQRIVGEVQSLAALTSARLWLRHDSRQELVLSGGDGATHDDSVQAGGGRWRRDRVQVVWREPITQVAAPAPVTVIQPIEACAIVSTRAGWLDDQLSPHRPVGFLADVGANASASFDAGPTGLALIGDVDDWQSRWGALAAVRSRASILFHGCSITDYRALTRSRELPPPLGTDPLLCWRLEPDGTVTRARLLAGATS